jgi:plasmid stabilization system protein ParE
VKLRIGKRAQRQAERIEEWWVEHRPAAPTLFTDELEHVFRVICERSDAGVSWPTSRRPKLRRILMPRTENHVYFQIDADGETVYVLSIWGGPRGATPKL